MLYEVKHIRFNVSLLLSMFHFYVSMFHFQNMVQEI